MPSNDTDCPSNTLVAVAFDTLKTTLSTSPDSLLTLRPSPSQDHNEDRQYDGTNLDQTGIPTSRLYIAELLEIDNILKCALDCLRGT